MQDAPPNSPNADSKLLVVKIVLAILLAAFYAYHSNQKPYIGFILLLIYLPASTQFVIVSSVLGFAGFPLFHMLMQAGISATPAGPFLAHEVLVALYFAFRGRLAEPRLRDFSSGDTGIRWQVRLCSLMGFVAAVLVVSLLFRAFPWVGHGSMAALLALICWTLWPQGVPMLPSASKLATNALLLSGSLIVSLILLEIGARVFIYPNNLNNPIRRYHPDYLFTFRPNVVARWPFRDTREKAKYVEYRISSQGLRDREHGPKADNEFRIVLIGDSYSFGTTVEQDEILSYMLERELEAADLPFEVSVVNLGIMATGPWQHRLRLEELGFPFEPDLVLHQTYLGNDVCDTLHEVDSQIEAYDVLEWVNLGWWRLYPYKRFQIDRYLLERSRIYRAVRTAVGPKAMYQFLTQGIRVLPTVTDHDVPPRAKRVIGMEKDLVEWYPVLEQAWEKLLNDVEKTYHTCRDRNVEYVTFNIPTQYTVRDEAWERETQLRKNVAYERGKGMRLYHEAMEQRKVPYFSVLEDVQARANNERLYYELDGHLTPLGNEVVTHAISEYLLSNYLSPEQTSAN